MQWRLLRQGARERQYPRRSAGGKPKGRVGGEVVRSPERRRPRDRTADGTETPSVKGEAEPSGSSSALQTQSGDRLGSGSAASVTRVRRSRGKDPEGWARALDSIRARDHSDSVARAES